MTEANSTDSDEIKSRLASYDSPDITQLQLIGGVEHVWTKLLDVILANCPDNREREFAIASMEIVRSFVRSSIIRGDKE